VIVKIKTVRVVQWLYILGILYWGDKMPEFKTKEEYEKWKAQRQEELKEKSADAIPANDPPPQEKTHKQPKKPKAHVKVQSSFIGSGCLIQGIGLMLFLGSFLMFPIGPFFGILVLIGFFIWGSINSRKLLCSECGNPIDNKKVKLCPACKVTF
jgi:hypothetical protein